jgi:hypothetical protein
MKITTTFGGRSAAAEKLLPPHKTNQAATSIQRQRRIIKGFMNERMQWRRGGKEERQPDQAKPPLIQRSL